MSSQYHSKHRPGGVSSVARRRRSKLLNRLVLVGILFCIVTSAIKRRILNGADNNGGYANEDLLIACIDVFETYESEEASKWASVFGTDNLESPAPQGSSVNASEDDNGDGSFDVSAGAEEFLNEFGGNAIKSPFQDGHYIYTVIAGGGSGQQSYSPILYIADLESPKNFNKKLQP